MRIAQITDAHLGLEGEDTFGVDVRANFLAVLAAARAARPDYLVLSGDLCFSQGEYEIYHWVKAQLDRTQIPYLVIPGNHDDARMMAQVFGLLPHLHDPDRLYFEANLQGHPVLFLDTAPYDLDATQLAWAEARLAAAAVPRLVFIHHPPLLAGVPFMDGKHALRNWAETLATLEAHPAPVHVFCGHYHVDKVVSVGNVTVYLTPSTFYQMDDNEPVFAVAHRRPGWRLIDWDGRQLRQGVKWLE